MGYPGVFTAVKTIRDGLIANMQLTVYAFKWMIEIWGRSLETLKGKMKGYSKSPSVGELDRDIEKSKDARPQSASMDIGFFEGVPFLVAVFKPLTYIITHELTSKDREDLGNDVKKTLNQIEKHGYVVKEIRFDREPAMKALEDHFAGLHVHIDYTGAGEAVWSDTSM